MCVRACTCKHWHMTKREACMYTCAEGDGYRGSPVVHPSVRPLPAIGYRRDVTDFTGRRANEKLVGCEVARGPETTIHLPSSSLVVVVPLHSSRHPRTPSLVVAFIRHSDRQPAATSQTLQVFGSRNIARFYHRFATIASKVIEIFE